MCLQKSHYVQNAAVELAHCDSSEDQVHIDEIYDVGMYITVV